MTKDIEISILLQAHGKQEQQTTVRHDSYAEMPLTTLKCILQCNICMLDITYIVCLGLKTVLQGWRCTLMLLVRPSVSPSGCGQSELTSLLPWVAAECKHSGETVLQGLQQAKWRQGLQPNSNNPANGDKHCIANLCQAWNSMEYLWAVSDPADGMCILHALLLIPLNTPSVH